MSKKIITHNDLDGGGAAIVISNVYGKSDVNITSLGYKNIVPYLDTFMSEGTYKKYDKVFVTDISLNEEDFESIFGEHPPKGVYFIDHHDTSRHTKDKKNCFWDQNKSGASLTYDLFLKTHAGKISHLEELIKYIEDYDLWKREYPKSDELNFIYFKYWSEKFISRFHEGNCNLTSSEQKYVDKKKDYIKKIQEETDWNLGYDNKICYATVPDMHNVVTNYVYEEVPELIGSLVFNSNPKVRALGVKARMEYLDKNDLSIGEFCEKFGGGGHRHVGAISGDALEEFKIENILEQFAEFLGIEDE